MTYLVFTQSEGGLIDTARLAHHASQFFGCAVDALEKAGDETRIALRSGRWADATFWVFARKAKREDFRAALDAEARGQVPGMGALAKDCEYAWQVEPGEGTSDDVVLLFCAILASVGLGPILPPDHSTLLNVRSARARSDKVGSPYRGSA